MRLIDSDNLLAEIKTLPIMSNWGETFFPQLVQEQSTVDAVPVVRCEKCAFLQSNGWVCGGTALMPPHHTFPNSFCSDGERKDKTNES